MHINPNTPSLKPGYGTTLALLNTIQPSRSHFTKLIKNRISNYYSSSLIPILAAINRLAKGIIAVIHKVTLLRIEVSALRKANKGLSKQRRAKKHVYGLEDHLLYRRYRIY